MKRIVVTGPESSGKTTLAQTLARAFDTVYVPEYARIHLAEKGVQYHLEDLIDIAIGQCALLESMVASAPDAYMIFMDTWMLELRIWAQYRFGQVPEIIEHAYHTQHPDLYLLCMPDIPWQQDALRENPLDRDALFEIYAAEIAKSAIPHVLVSGSGAERETVVIEWLKQFFHPVV